MNMPHRRRLPPEWAPQSAVMLTWPHEGTDWAPLLAQVEPVYCAIAAHVSTREAVLIVCRDEAHRDHIQQRLQANDPIVNLTAVRFAIAPSNDTWARDHGPLTVLEDGRPVILDFVFTGWGNKFAADLDNAITARLAAAGIFGKTPVEPQDLILEGGGIDVDGAGTLLTTTQCLLNPNRNPHLAQAQIEERLRQAFGVERILWLHHGHLAGDDTDAHIDTLARFCDTSTIAYVRCEDPADEHYAPLRAMEAELQALRTVAGKPYRLVPLPLPAPQYAGDGHRLPATHANFLIINGAVLVPTYNDPTDAVALERLAGAFPHHEIIGVPCLPLIQQHGSLHCITMQLPAEVLP